MPSRPAASPSRRIQTEAKCFRSSSACASDNSLPMSATHGKPARRSPLCLQRILRRRPRCLIRLRLRSRGADCADYKAPAICEMPLGICTSDRFRRSLFPRTLPIRRGCCESNVRAVASSIPRCSKFGCTCSIIRSAKASGLLDPVSRARWPCRHAA